eukprot:UC1_evm2s796
MEGYAREISSSSGVHADLTLRAMSASSSAGGSVYEEGRATSAGTMGSSSPDLEKKEEETVVKSGSGNGSDENVAMLKTGGDGKKDFVPRVGDIGWHGAPGVKPRFINAGYAAKTKNQEYEKLPSDVWRHLAESGRKWGIGGNDRLVFDAHGDS